MSSISKESEFLLSAARKGRLTHCVMLSGSSAQTEPVCTALAAALLCPSGGEEDCSCSVCRRVREGIHPDVVTIDRGESIISVDDVRELRAQAVIAPLEAARKIFILKNAHNMNAAAQNAALKLFEEPPAGVGFLLTCENHAAMLQTIRSRCMTVTLGGEDAHEVSEEDLREAKSQAQEFAAALAKDDELELYLACIKLEKQKRPAAAAFFDAALEMVRGALLCSVGMPAEETVLSSLGTQKLYRMADILLRRRADVDRNVGVAHLMGTISAEYFGDSDIS